MKNNSELIDEILKKVKLTVSERDKLAKLNSQLVFEKERLLDERSKYVSQIKELKNELKAMKLAVGLSDKESKTQAKKYLGNILKEVDKCIELVNKK